MKHKLFYIILCIGFVLTGATACSEDDENSPAVTPTATGTMHDNDGNEYTWVRIGQLDWMAESMRGGAPWYEQSYITENGLLSYLYARDDEEAEERLQRYGNLYTYQQALDLCPDGWRLPTDDDWKQLETTLGMSSKEADKEGWRKGAAQLLTAEQTGLCLAYAGQLASYSTASIDEYHFGDYGYYWTSTINPDTQYECAYIRKITPAQPSMVQRVATMTNYRYLSVRYCRDAK